MTPPRDEMDQDGNKFKTYDVVFHPNTYRMAESMQNSWRCYVRQQSMQYEKVGIFSLIKNSKFYPIKNILEHCHRPFYDKSRKTKKLNLKIQLCGKTWKSLLKKDERNLKVKSVGQ